MKKSVMQKWVKALRSGKYKQGSGMGFEKIADIIEKNYKDL